jgi:hypothetical protein
MLGPGKKEIHTCTLDEGDMPRLQKIPFCLKALYRQLTWDILTPMGDSIYFDLKGKL